MEEMETFLITGATGFLGSALVERVLDDGYSVIGLGRKKQGFLSNNVLRNKNFTLLQKDLLSIKLDDFEPFKIDGIFHLVSQQPSSQELDYREFYDGNVESSLKAIELAKFYKYKFFIYISSISIFGKKPDTNVILESSCSIPTNYYGLTKYHAERLLEIELADAKTKVIILRFPSLFGKNHLGGVVHTFYQLAKNNKQIDVFSSGMRYRSLLYVQDAASLLLISAQKNANLSPFEIFNCGSSDSVKMIDIAKTITKLIGSSSTIIPVDKFSPTDWDVFIDISKIKKKLCFQPLSIEQGIKLYLKELGHEV